MITKTVGVGEIRTTLTGYTKLITFYENCRGYRNKDILVSFDDLSWFDANMCALLKGIIHKLALENNLIFYVESSGTITEKFDILIRNGFLETLTAPRGKTGSEITLKGFRPSEDVAFLKYVENSLLAHQSLTISEREKSLLIDSFLEVFVNVEKHADTSHPIFACGQYYPNKHLLNFTLVDLGVGYLPPIREFTNGRVKDSRGAILWALEGNSSKKGAPGGLGLRQIQEHCAKNDSTFGIITGGSYWDNKRSKVVSTKQFCGTVVNLIFTCK